MKCRTYKKSNHQAKKSLKRIRSRRMRGGETPLISAIENNDVPKALQLIKEGIGINERDKYDATPLHYAVESGMVEVVHALITAGADVNYRNDNGNTPLHASVLQGDSTIVDTLLNAGANANSKSSDGITPILFSKFPEIVDSLLKHGANMNDIDRSGRTLLHRTIMLPYENTDLIKYLISHNADINVRDSYGISPLLYAYDKNHPNIIKLLLDAGAKKIEEFDPSYFNKFLVKQSKHKHIYKPMGKHTRKIRNVANTNMKQLVISSLSDIPSSFDNSLQKLVIHPVGATSIPMLPSNLLYLECSGNPLVALPELPKTLRSLVCSNCALESLPDLPDSLEYMDVRYNKIKDIHKIPPKLVLAPVSRINNNSETRVLLLEGNPLPLGFLNGIGPIGKYSKKIIHDTINLGDTYVSTMILPKGTLLFRNVENYKEEEIKGISMKNGTSYIYPNYNIFFYPYPFVGDSYIKTAKVLVFETVRDVEIVMAIPPSINKRSNRFEEEYLTSCDKVQNVKIKGRSYDPCFTESFSKQHPNISGLIAIAAMDVRHFIDNYIAQRYFTKYRSNIVDNPSLAQNEKNNNLVTNLGNNVGVPEIILHPLSNRYDNTSDPNYVLHVEIDHTAYKFDDAWEFVEDALSEGSWTIDLLTRMYVNYNSVSDEVKKRCVPIEEPYKLHWLNTSYEL